jgi:hypothetical protein
MSLRPYSRPAAYASMAGAALRHLYHHRANYRRIYNRARNLYQTYRQSGRPSSTTMPKRVLNGASNYIRPSKRRRFSKSKRTARKTPRKTRKRMGPRKAILSKGVRAAVKDMILRIDEPLGKLIKEQGGYMTHDATNSQAVYSNLKFNGSGDSKTAFAFFQPRKILDAASVLFNGKAFAADWTLTPGNFQTLDSDLSKVGLIHVKYASVAFEMTAQTGLPQEVTIYESVATRDAQNAVGSNAPFQVWTDGLANTDMNLAGSNILTLNSVPSHAPMFNDYFTTKAYTYKLNPGDVKTHYTKIGNKTYDFTKFFKNGNFHDVQKGLTTFYTVVIKGPMQIQGGGSDGTTQALQINQYNLSGAAGIAVRLVEKFSIHAPDVSNDANKLPVFAVRAFHPSFDVAKGGTTRVKPDYVSTFSVV